MTTKRTPKQHSYSCFINWFDCGQQKRSLFTYTSTHRANSKANYVDAIKQWHNKNGLYGMPSVLEDSAYRIDW